MKMITKLAMPLVLALASTTASAQEAWVEFECNFGGKPIWLQVIGDDYYVHTGTRQWPVEGDFDPDLGIVRFIDRPEDVVFLVDMAGIDNRLMVKADAYVGDELYEGLCSASMGG